MSEDASPAGGQRTPPSQDAAADHNNSLIEIVRSRVSSIIPFSKWFSPTAGGSTPPSGEAGSRNGGVRRRRDETLFGEQTVERDTSDLWESEADEGDQDAEDGGPPTKRNRLDLTEDHSTMTSFQMMHPTKSNNFISSTPTTFVGRRKQLGLASPTTHQSLRSTTSTTTTTKTTIRSLGPAIVNATDDGHGRDSDEVEIIPRHRSGNYAFQQPWEATRPSSSRPIGTLELKRPTRRPSLHSARGNGPTPSTSVFASGSNAISIPQKYDDANQYETQPDDEGKNNEILTNGVRASPHLLNADTASDSGDSQTSSVQKPKVTEGGMYGTGAKRFQSYVSSGLNYAAHLQGKKSLFGDKTMPSHLHNSTTSLTSLNRRQNFNASLYGSTSALSDSRLLNIYSPFYKGSTTYGGAAAYSKYSQNPRQVSQSSGFVRPSSSLSVASSSASATRSHEHATPISNTAKRILELMNQFTTPLSDAKKMASNIKVPALTAHRQRFGDADRSLNRGIRMSHPKTPYSRPTAAQSTDAKKQSPPGPRLNELHVPSMSQLLQMKKLQSNTEKIREITRMNQAKVAASAQKESEKQEYRLPHMAAGFNDDKEAAGPIKHVNKIKNKLTSTRSSAKSIDDEPPSQVALPDIQLPLKESAVPKIDIDIKRSTPTDGRGSMVKSDALNDSIKHTENRSSMQHTTGDKFSTSNSPSIFGSTTSAVNAKNQSHLLNQAQKTEHSSSMKKSGGLANGGLEFIFSAPIEVAPPQTLVQHGAVAESNYKFSDPVPVHKSTNSPASASNFSFKASNSSAIAKPIAAQSSASSGVRAGGSPAAVPQLKTTGSVLDAFKKPTPVEATSTSVSASSSSSTGFGAQFKMSSDKWECSVCMIRNEKAVDKCVACLSARKASESTGATLSSGSSSIKSQDQFFTKPLQSSANSFGDQFKAKSDTWECPTCMIRNKAELSKCEACMTLKPGANPTGATGTRSFVSSSSSLSSSVPNKTSDSGFKSIVAAQSAKWECSACMTRNESARNKCACCEQAKPGATSDSAPQFSFGASTSTSKFSFGFINKKEDEAKSDSNLQTNSTTGEAAASKPSFSFGLPSTTAATPASSSASFTFGFKPTAKSADSGTGTMALNKDEPDKPATPKVSFESSSEPKLPESLKNSSSTEKPADTSSKTQETKNTLVSGSFTFGSSPSTSAFSSAAVTASPSKSAADSNSQTISKLTTGSSSSIFKPIGSMAFGPSGGDGAKTHTFSFGASASKTSTAQGSTQPAAQSSGDFGSLPATTQQTDDKISSSDNNSIGGKKTFTFGAASTTAKSDSKTTTENKPAGGFSFGSPSGSIIGGTAFKSPLAAKTESSAPAANATPSFVFGKPSAPTSITPTFGAISSNIITSSNPSAAVSTAAPSFGALSAATTQSTASSFQPAVTPSLTAPAFGSGNSQGSTPLFGSSNFGSAPSNAAVTANKPATNLFQFGSGSKPAESTTTTASAPIFGNVSSTTNARFSFGSSGSAPNPAPAQSTPFLFGSSANAEKPNEPVANAGLFGAAAVQAQNSAPAPSLPSFGSFSSPMQQTPQQPLQQSQSVTFGQTNAISSPFGVNLANNAPAFGSSPAAPAGANISFGASGASAFGSPAAKTPLFGNGFGSTPAQGGDEPSAKKQTAGFNFGAAPANPTGGFSFGSSNLNNNNNNNNNNNKQAFAFTPSSTPTFNFSGSGEATIASQPFQFGAPQITPAAFNFSGIETASNAPFQFNAAAAANNIFAPTPTPGSSVQSTQLRRKARTVMRRTQQR